jgi:hypothetical protein
VARATWRRSKFRAIRTNCGKHVHASKREAKHCVELQQLEQAGEIVFFTQQPRFKLEVKGHHICDYIADFRYIDKKTRAAVVVDVKGMKTPVYRLKKKLMWACLGIEVVET